MKKIYTLFLSLIFAGCLMAQAPQSFKYQAVARNASGDVLADQAVGIQISILPGSTSGTAVYTETHVDTTNSFGLINLEIGNGTTSDDFSSINWSSDTYFVKVEMDITGGTTYEEYGTSQLLSVPYALHARTAANAFSGNYSDLTGTPSNVSTFTNDVGYLTFFTETDPVFTAWDKSYNDLTNKPNIIDSISTVIDTTTQFVRTEIDGDINNEIQTISRTDLTVTLSNGGGTFTDSVNIFSGDMQNQNITNLANPINDQDAATKAYVDLLENKINMLNNTLDAGGKVTDYDGNSYNTVKIGDQIWMAENLKTTHYVNGDAIPLVTDNTAWGNLTTPGYCWYDNDEATYGDTYGALYNWYTVNTGNLCPAGWHIPTDAEWTTLTNYLGETSVAGGKLKETDTTHWSSPNTGATNESGFTALPGGYRSNYGLFYFIGLNGYWWSSTELDATSAWFRYLNYVSAYVFRSSFNKELGFSVRCLRD